MNGIHDMGGMQDMGAICREINELVFHHAWEGRAYAMAEAALATGKLRLRAQPGWENLGPREYLRMSYYELWFASLKERLVFSDLVSRAEIESGRTALGSVKLSLARSPQEAVAHTLRTPKRRTESILAKFREGQQVRTRKLNPVTHTRLPRYARGRTGTIHRDHGVFAFADTAAYSLGDNPQHLYSVRFTARELWGDQAAPQDAVYLDLYDDYLEPA